jgi:hypothetical protein
MNENKHCYLGGPESSVHGRSHRVSPAAYSSRPDLTPEANADAHVALWYDNLASYARHIPLTSFSIPRKIEKIENIL